MRTYPSNLLQQPADVNRASFTFNVGVGNSSKVSAAGSTVQTSANSSVALRKAAGPFADRMAIPTLGPLTFLLALLAAFGYGAAHALTPELGGLNIVHDHRVQGHGTGEAEHAG